jgi:hypothetical protein
MDLAAWQSSASRQPVALVGFCVILCHKDHDLWAVLASLQGKKIVCSMIF